MRYILIGKRTAITICMLAITVCAALVYGAGQLAQTTAVNAGNCPIYSVETEQPLVSLGINCAWGNEDIPQLLKILDAYSVKATFFVVGDWCDKYPDSVKAIYDAGHEIGSHSDTHADMAQLDREGILREIHDSSRKIEALTGQAPILFRPPSGSFNTQVVQVIREEGMYPIQWDCEGIHIKTIKHIAPNGLEIGAVFLFDFYSVGLFWMGIVLYD